MFHLLILDLHHDGLSERQIAWEVGVSHTYVGKVIKRYKESNTDLKAQRSHFVKPKGVRPMCEKRLKNTDTIAFAVLPLLSP